MVDLDNLLAEIGHVLCRESKRSGKRIGRQWQFVIDEIQILLRDRVDRHARRDWLSRRKYFQTLRRRHGRRISSKADVDREDALAHARVRHSR